MSVLRRLVLAGCVVALANPAVAQRRPRPSAPSDPNVIYVGTGESPIRGNVSPGNGVYKSTDAGKTWTHIGLANAGQIGAIRVHPANADLVYVAVLGHAFGPNPDRGVFRSKDGGKTWEKVLFRSDSAGAVDLALDPANPRKIGRASC